MSHRDSVAGRSGRRVARSALRPQRREEDLVLLRQAHRHPQTVVQQVVGGVEVFDQDAASLEAGKDRVGAAGG